jgi:hypothetical protein
MMFRGKASGCRHSDGHVVLLVVFPISPHAPDLEGGRCTERGRTGSGDARMTQHLVPVCLGKDTLDVWHQVEP